MKILIIGAGGHAKVIAEIVGLLGHTLIGFLDDNPDLKKRKLATGVVLDSVKAFESYSFDQVILGIGNNLIRQKLCDTIFSTLPYLSWFKAVHPKAVISTTANLGVGTVVMAGAVINSDAVIGNHVIINTGATVDHDCVLDDYVHIAPGVNLAGGVKISEGTLMGVSSCAIPNVQIGKWATIGAGSTVIHNLPNNTTAIGTPARILYKRQ